MKNGRHSQYGVEIKIKIADRYKEYRRAKAPDGPDNFGDQGEQKKNVVYFHSFER